MTESLPELLRSLRASALLSQEALAERAGLSTRTISDIETGAARSPRLVTVMLLAEALGLSATDRSRLKDAARKAPGGRSSAPVTSTATLNAVALVGRDADVNRLSALLARDEVRLVTLAGPAGVGKTSLAARVGTERARAFELGATLVELAPIADPALVPAAVRRALGIREYGDAAASEAVMAHLRDRGALLVLDNLEHLTPAATWIGALLAACPRLVILATSREPLRLRDERVYAVRPLENTAAVVLFVQRAQMVQPDFELTPANAEAVETIVAHLEGLPLAIELAAPRLLLLPPKALAARLERRLPLLGDGALDRPERQQTMHGAIAWSYDLLSEDEQRLFRQLSVLQNGGTLDAAAALAGAADAERSILFRVAPLVEKNMLSLAEDNEAEPRVSMLEMLREFAQERLTERGEFDEVAQRHAKHVLAFAQSAEPGLSGASQGRWLARFEVEHGNIRAALQWLAQREETATGFLLLAAVWRFWWMHGHLTDGVEWMRRFLQLRLASPIAVADEIYAKILRAYVVLLSALGNFEEAHVWCEQAIALQHGIGDEAGLSASLTSLGIILQSRGEYDQAQDAHVESLEIRRRIGDDAGVATSLSNLSAVAFSKNDLALAVSLGNDSVAIYRRLGHESGLAHALMKLGLAATGERNYQRAEELFNECLRMHRKVGNTGSMIYSLVNLGAVAHKRGDYRLALKRFHEALDLFDAMPNKSALTKAFEDLALTTAALGDPTRAARLLGAADGLRRSIGSPMAPVERLEYEAEVSSLRGMLGDDAFDVQWRIGASVTLQRAIEEARATRELGAVRSS